MDGFLAKSYVESSLFIPVRYSNFAHFKHAIFQRIQADKKAAFLKVSLTMDKI